MFNSVQYVRELCKKRKIPISQLEKDCGFSNGYLNPKKMNKISYERAKTIAEYLDVSVDSILTGEETEKAPIETDERKYTDDEIMFALSRGGEGEITDEMFQEVKNFAAYIAQREATKKEK